MHYEKLLESDYLKAADLNGGMTTQQISKVEIQTLSDEKKGEKSKGVVFFDGKKKGWVLNRTNILCLVALFGDDTDGWVGHRVTLFADTVRGADGKQTPAIRVKGSPDIAAPIEAEIKLPRRRATHMTLIPTGKPVRQQEGG